MNRNRGFSLVELLVSLVIASIIFSGVVQVAVSGKRTALDGREVAFIQDNARFVIDHIKRDARLAGYLGCASITNTVTSSAVNNEMGGMIRVLEGIQGFEGDLGNYPSEYSSDVTTGTDSFLVRFADASTEYKVKSHNHLSAEFTLWTNQHIARGSTMVVTDSSCRAVGLFQVTGPNINSDKLLHVSDGTRNCTKVLKSELDDIGCFAAGSAPCSGATCGGLSPKAFQPGSTIMPYRSYAYYIGDSDIVPNMPALKRRVLTASGGFASTISEEIALGVEDMQITYGFDVNGDGVANRFVDADDISDWTKVVSLRLHAVFRSSEEVFRDNQNVQIDLDGSNFSLSDDKFMRQVVSTTVSLRNI